jgi:putative methyltransferase (TIGR04325 family)
LAAVTQFFPNYAAALAACGSGYNDADIADVIAYKTALALDPRVPLPDQVINTIVSLGVAAAEVSERPLTVLDYGGGCGFHYFRAIPMFRTALRWAIVETPVMAERAAKLGRGRFDVFTDLETAAATLGRIDLVHASGVIPYVPNPPAALKELASLRPRYFLLARFPVWRGATRVGLQSSFLSENGIGPMPPGVPDRQVEFPVTFVNFDDAMEAFAGYGLVSVLGSPSGAYEVNGHHLEAVTLLFRLQG